MALGVAARLVPRLESNPRRFRRFVQVSFPVALGMLLVLGASPWIADRIKQSRESARPLPPPGSPNVLLIVLDTVAAGHLSLYGYQRATSTTLVELAERGIRFDSAQATSSWTLPSHATMFTGRWMHELSVGWLNPLDDDPSHAGRVPRGATATRRPASSPTPRIARAIRAWAAASLITKISSFPSSPRSRRPSWAIASWPCSERSCLSWRTGRRSLGCSPMCKGSGGRSSSIARERRRSTASCSTGCRGGPQPERPFFAFLNYSDAHTPYELSPGRIHRFGVAQPDERQRELIRRWGDLDKVRLVPQDLPFAVDAYDDCIADLDEQLGKLLDKLRRRGVLDRTWLIIASDHGESFGEHAGVFCHGTSLYQTELHVPLLIVPPGGHATKQVVKETVSLRDLAATIVDVLGLEAGSPFPGSSLARYWDGSRRRHRRRLHPPIPRCPRWSRASRINRRRLRFAPKVLAAGSPERRRLVVHPQRRERPRGIVPPEQGRQRSSATWPAIQPRSRFSSGCAKPWAGSRAGRSCRSDSIADDLTRASHHRV